MIAATVCSIHFDENSHVIPLRQQLLNYCSKNNSSLKPNAVPTLHLPKSSHQSQKPLSMSFKLGGKRRRAEVHEFLEVLIVFEASSIKQVKTSDTSTLNIQSLG